MGLTGRDSGLPPLPANLATQLRQAVFASVEPRRVRNVQSIRHRDRIEVRGNALATRLPRCLVQRASPVSVAPVNGLGSKLDRCAIGTDAFSFDFVVTGAASTQWGARRGVLLSGTESVFID